MTGKDQPFKKVITCIQLLLALSAITGSGLILTGYIYRLGYLSAFGVGIGTVPLSLNEGIGEAFYLGLIFSSQVVEFIKYPLYLLISIVLCVVAAWGYFKFTEDDKPFKKMENWALSQKKQREEPFTWQRLMFVLDEELLPFFLPILLCLGLLAAAVIIIAVSPYRLGEENGKDQILKFQEIDHECMRLPEKSLICGRVVEVTDGRLIDEGLILSGNSESHVVLYDGDIVSVYIRNPEHVLHIHSRIPSGTK